MVLWMIFAAMTAAGLVFVIWPLLRPRAASASAPGASDLEVYRDQLAEIERDLARGLLNAGEAEAARREISRRLLAADAARSAGEPGQGAPAGALRRTVAAAVIVAVPAVGLAFYLVSGSPGLEGRPLAERLAGPLESRDLPELVARVEAHLRKNPDDSRGWRVLAPVYVRLGRFADAADAYDQVLRVEGRDAAVLAEFGEALVRSEGGLVTARARKAFDEAARLDPELAKPRYFQGLALLQDGRKDAALALWRGLLAESAPDAPWRGLLERQIAAAEGTTAPAAPAPGSSAPGIDRETMAAAQDMSAEDRAKMIEGMVARLAERLDTRGGEIGEWLRLARAQAVLGRKADASATLERARGIFAGKAEDLGRIDSLATSLGLN